MSRAASSAICEPSKIICLTLSSDDSDEVAGGGGVVSGSAGVAGGGGEGAADGSLAAGEGLEDLDCLGIGHRSSRVRVARQHIAERADAADPEDDRH